MKKLVAILLAVIFVLTLTSCASAYSSIVEQLEEKEMSGYFYTESQITALKDENGIKENITAFANFSSIDENENEIYLYIAELETEEMAESYKNTYAKDFQYAIVSDNVVIYGNDSVINDLAL